MLKGTAKTGDTVLTLNVHETLEFFDDPSESAMGHATAVVGVLGEDLAASLFSHCVEANKLGNVEVMQGTKVVRGGRKGPWLDRWIKVQWSNGGATLFQTEIKNGSSHGTRGKKLALDASETEIRNRKLERWGEIWDPVKQGLTWKEAAKVLVPMRPPEGWEKEDILPLLILWDAVWPGCGDGFVDVVEGGHLFKVKNPKLLWPFEGSDNAEPPWNFPHLVVFSMSSYLRCLPRDHPMKLTMPDAAVRIETLARLIPGTIGS